MEINKIKGVIEAILFAAGREVKMNELMSALELSSSEIIPIVESMKAEYQEQNRGLQIVNIGEAYQLCTKQEYYEYLYPIIDKRSKPNLSQAALETLAIIAYNPRVTRAEIEQIRGVNSDGTIYKLLDYNLIQETGKLDAPGKPGTYGVTSEFLRIFGIGNLEELPDLPRYKLDQNQQIVIDDIIEEKPVDEEELEALAPERENEGLEVQNNKEEKGEDV
ncbi:MAG: SMC-Scp complex subunit ScpB [Clostridia bacterium]|jgi:segregation and condensation protein B|nr:SMC-Scp complex subunit ScpB [Clostridia bacterium]